MSLMDINFINKNLKGLDKNLGLFFILNFKYKEFEVALNILYFSTDNTIFCLW